MRPARGHSSGRFQSPGLLTSARDGHEATDILSNSPSIDLVLSDVVLPGGVSGVAFHDTAKEDRPRLKYLFMSGYAESRARHLPEGIELLDKPFGLQQLAQRVRATLDR